MLKVRFVQLEPRPNLNHGMHLMGEVDFNEKLIRAGFIRKVIGYGIPPPGCFEPDLLVSVTRWDISPASLGATGSSEAGAACREAHGSNR